MADVRRNIVLSVEMINNITGVGKTIATSMKAVRGGFEKVTQEIDRTSGMVTKTSKSFINGVNPMKRFKMELLGVMFFGMGLQKMMMGLIKPGADMVGVFELLSVVLGLMFLPIGMQLLDWVIALLGWWTSLSPATQGVINIIVALVAVFGTLLFVFGTMALGFNALAALFTGGGALAGIGAFFSGIFTAIGASIGVFMIVLAALVLVIIAFVIAWQENFGRIKEWADILFAGLADIFGGIFDLIKSIFGFIVAVFSGDTKKMKEMWTNIWKAILRIASGLFQVLVGLVVTLGLTLFRLLVGLLKTILTLLGAGFGFIWEKLILGGYEFGKNLISNMIKGIGSMAGALKSYIRGLISSLLGGRGGGGGGSSSSGSSSGSTGTTKKGDFVVTPSGVIESSPADYIIGTKNPGALGGNGSISFNPSITVNASSNVDIERLKSQLSTEWKNELDQMMRR